jgi:sterol desaturase/sphingolipid hydroxylase (fatty acid hydroxylase superfamily)
VEFLVPYQKRWSMTWRSLWADLKFVALNGTFIGLTSATLALFAISMSEQSQGPATDWPYLIQLVCCLLTFEAVNYTIHRTMHEARGRTGRFLWRTHAAHHLPPRLYLVMHAVGHPLNGIIIQVFALILPVYLMGYDQTVVTFFLMINGMHGLITHFNVDVRMGWANYIFVGAELHRYHHSADVNEAKNYGNTLSIFDLAFGTFVYRPGTPPETLGVDEAEGFPPYERTFQVISMPFRRTT